jgi:hypothetical protein
MALDLSQLRQMKDRLGDYEVRDGKIRSPGKFEGECRYVPYFWDVFLEGGTCTEHDDDVLEFEVDAQEDVGLFPELAGRKAVFLKEDDQGFVREVDGPSCCVSEK